jgi:hypothetical protein
VAQTLEQIDVIKRLAAEYKDDLYFATSAAGKSVLMRENVSLNWIMA